MIPTMNRSKLTAIKRDRLSVPSTFLLNRGYLSRGDWFLPKGLDYGCGHGFDALILDYDKYDPNFEAYNVLSKRKYPIILCTYVLNVIPTQDERDMVLRDIREHLSVKGKAYITVRRDGRKLKGWTSKGTYQTWIELDLPVVHETSNYCIYEMTK